MRTIVLSDDAGSGALDPLWFPGGHQLHNIEGDFVFALRLCKNSDSMSIVWH